MFVSVYSYTSVCVCVCVRVFGSVRNLVFISIQSVLLCLLFKSNTPLNTAFFVYLSDFVLTSSLNGNDFD